MLEPRLHDTSTTAIPRRDWYRAWVVVAANSFGGPAGQIAVMHDELVERRGWVPEERFLHALHYCMLLPGPEAQQLATYLGWLLRGPAGGLVAGGLFIVPGFLSIMGLSVLFAVHGDVAWVQGVFSGITAAVVAIVAHAVQRIGRRVIHTPLLLGIAVAAFVAILFLQLAFPVVVLAAALVGVVASARAPRLLSREMDVDVPGHDASGAAGLAAERLGRPTLRRSLRVLGTGLALWFGPIVGLLLLDGPTVFVDIGWFFSSAAVLTFGGAYSVLAYIAQEGVTTFGWLLPGEMTSGLGMAETTPGPLIQVVQFVGFLAAYRDPGGLSALQGGVAGAVLATWVTFVPSFLWIFLGAPFMERLRGQPALAGALTTVTAAVVGAVCNLAVWFALYALFAEVRTHTVLGRIVLYEPVLGSVDVAGVAIALAAAVAVFRHRVPTWQVVVGAAVAGLLARGLT